MKLLFLGPPGAGKGTLSEILLKDENLAHVSTGDIFRAEMGRGSELGKLAKSYIDSGKLVPDEVVADMVAGKLLSAECANGFLLDGFPRTIRQAELLENALSKAGKKLDAVVLFDAPEEGKKVVSVINMFEAFHIPEARDISLSLPCAARPAKVRRVSSGEEMPFAWENGTCTVHFDALKCCEMVEVSL